jgi:anti-sigma regulatory factor (Ser/Thr protein kinase)
MTVPDHLLLNAVGYPSCDAADWIAAWAVEHGLSHDTQFAMRLCVEELVANWANHGLTREPPGHSVELTARATTDGAAVDIVDDGIPFDITTARDPGREGSVTDASIGGRGIRMMRAFAHSMCWHGVKCGNRTTFTFTDGTARTTDVSA